MEFSKLKGNAQFVQKATFELLMDFKQNHNCIMEVGNITKAATSESFLHLSYKIIQLLFFVTVLFNIFMRQTLTDDFWGLDKTMNCAFPLKSQKLLRGMFFTKSCTQIFMIQYLYLETSNDKNTECLTPTILGNSRNYMPPILFHPLLNVSQRKF